MGCGLVRGQLLIGLAKAIAMGIPILVQADKKEVELEIHDWQRREGWAGASLREIYWNGTSLLNLLAPLTERGVLVGRQEWVGVVAL